MKKKFKGVEEAFEQLKGKFRLGKISRKEFVEQLEKLRLKDEEGRFWMIGVRSGKWYYFNGTDWIQSEPPSLKDKKAICIYCGFENRLEAEACVRCGGNLEEKEKSIPESDPKLDESSQELLSSSKEKQGWERRNKEASIDEKTANFVFRSLSPLSFLVFLGSMGIFVGVIMGAFAGATGSSSGIVKIMPSFIQEIKGNLLGALIYACLGGVFGFIIFGFFGFCIALLTNVISSFVGGVKICIDKISEK